MEHILIYSIEEGSGFWVVIRYRNTFKNLGYHYDTDFPAETWEVLMEDMRAMCEFTGAIAFPWWIDLTEVVAEKMAALGLEDGEAEILDTLLKETPEILDAAIPTLWHPQAQPDERGSVGRKRYFKVVLAEHYESFDETETILVVDDIDGTASLTELVDAALIDLWHDALVSEPPDRRSFWYDIKDQAVSVTYEAEPVAFGQYNRMAGTFEVFEPTSVEVLRGKAYRANEPPEFWHADYLPQLPTSEYFEEFEDGRYYRLDYTITGQNVSPFVPRGKFACLIPYLAAHAGLPNDPTLAELTSNLLECWQIESGVSQAAIQDNYSFRRTIYNAIGQEHHA